MKSGAKKAAAPIVVKKSPDAQALKEQDAKFRSTFVEAMRSSSPPRSEPVLLPEAIIVPGLSPPAGPKPLPLVQQAHKPVAKIAPAKAGAKKGAAKAGAAKSGAKTGGKTGAKLGAKAGAKAGAKVGNLIMKRVEPLNLDSLTSREPEKEVEEETKAKTTRIEEKSEFSVQTEETKHCVDEGIQGGDFQEYLKNQSIGSLTCETILNTDLGISSKIPPVIKILQTLSFKRIIKPCPDLYFCESVQTIFSFEMRPMKDIKLANLNIKKFSALMKPPIGLLYTEQFAFRIISKPIPKLSFTEEVISSYSVLYPPQRNLYQLGTQNLGFEVLCKPQVPLYLYIPPFNLPLTPTIEVIENLNLTSCTLSTIETLAFSYNSIQKPLTELIFDEDCFTSKHKSIMPSIRLMKNQQVEEEDWKIRRGPPVIEILSTMEFELTTKPDIDLYFYQKEFVEMCLQTEEILEENEGKKSENLNGEVLTFDEFFSKLEISTPKNNNEPASFQFFDQALNRISEMENLKREVKERENMKFKRNKAAIKLQAWARGVLARRKYIPPILEVYKERLRKRKLADLAVRIKRSWAPYVILNALQCWYKMKQREKQRLYRLFLNFSANNIQRYWRGYLVRRFYRKQILRISAAKKKLRNLVRDWKCRKIMKTRRIKHIFKGIIDTHQVLSDLKIDRSSIKLVQQLQSQLSSYISKLRSDFNTLYISGKWTNLPVYRESFSMADSTISLKFPQPQEDQITSQPSFINRDDIPIRPLAMNYEDLLKDFPEQPQSSPPPPQVRKKINKKFPPIKFDDKKKEEKKIEEKINSEIFVFNENLEEIRQDDVQKHSGKPKEFLKRKSKAIKPQKVEWKVARRIDCWLPKENIKKKEIGYDMQGTMPRGDFLRLGDIEKEFQNDLSSWTSLEVFFDREVGEESKVPQLDIDSKCLKMYMDGNYTMYIEELESHYTYLCSEDVLSG